MRQKEQLIELPKVVDKRGNLSFIEARKHIPFDIARTYWIHDIPGGQHRGNHAFKSQQEMIIALAGSFDVVLHDGTEQRTHTLNRSYMGLHVPNMMWRSLENFSTNSICLVITSEPYDENDYIRNFKEFKKNLTIQKKDVSPIASKNEISSMKRELFNEYNSVFDCSLIEFPVIKNRAGSITPVHTMDNIPFNIERVFYIYDIPNGVTRGMHAHKHCHEVLIAASGSFDVELDDGTNKRIVTLNRPSYGLHIPPGVWASEKEYSSGVVCLALASENYDTEDYIYTYSDFKKYRASESQH